MRESGPLDIEREGDGDVGEDDDGVGEDHGDDDGPRRRSGATGSKGERSITPIGVNLSPRSFS